MSDDSTQYSVVIHDAAAQMLYSHVRFLSNVSVSAARKLRSALFDAFTSLEKMPQRCPLFSTRRALCTYHRMIVGRYQVVFSINEKSNTVNIYYILDSRQDNDI